MLTASADLIVEGVAVARALRKALGQTAGRPCDRLLVLERPRLELSPGQRAMAKGVDTVLAEILPELRARGVAVEVAA